MEPVRVKAMCLCSTCSVNMKELGKEEHFQSEVLQERPCEEDHCLDASKSAKRKTKNRTYRGQAALKMTCILKLWHALELAAHRGDFFGSPGYSTLGHKIFRNDLETHPETHCRFNRKVGGFSL